MIFLRFEPRVGIVSDGGGFTSSPFLGVHLLSMKIQRIAMSSGSEPVLPDMEKLCLPLDD